VQEGAGTEVVDVTSAGAHGPSPPWSKCPSQSLWLLDGLVRCLSAVAVTSLKRLDRFELLWTFLSNLVGRAQFSMTLRLLLRHEVLPFAFHILHTMPDTVVQNTGIFMWHHPLRPVPDVTMRRIPPNISALCGFIERCIAQCVVPDADGSACQGTVLRPVLPTRLRQHVSYLPVCVSQRAKCRLRCA
jgi:hypothetical protein